MVKRKKTKRPIKALFISKKTKKGTRVVSFKDLVSLNKGIARRRKK